MPKDKLYEQRIREYTKNIKLNIFFNEEGMDLNTLIKEVILNNCNPVEKRKLEL